MPNAPETWNIADVWDVVAESIPDAPAQGYEDVVHTWRDFDRRARGVAATLLAHGARQQFRLAQAR